MDEEIQVINSSYEKKKVEKKDLAKIVKQVRSDEISGVNITVPFKKEIIDFLDQVKGVARSCQSVNTLVKEGNKVCGYNTDVEGFKEVLVMNLLISEIKKHLFWVLVEFQHQF